MKPSHSHLPTWLAENWLFRKLFLLRKMYLTQRKFSHYGQFAEDVSIVRHFPKEAAGFFVDVGGFHPVKYNNTYTLYRRGWRGVNIDLDPIKIDGFDMLRPQDVNIACAISDVPGEVTVWSSGFYSGTTSLDPDFAETYGGDLRSYTVQADTLTNVLDRTRFEGQSIDFLNVDVEGHDLPVLRSLDFERYQPGVIAVESHHEELSNVIEGPLFRFLSERGYDLVNWTGVTLILKRTDADD